MARMSMGNMGGGSFTPLTMISIFAVISAMGGWFSLLGGASAIQHKADIIAALLNENTLTGPPILTYMDLPPLTEPRKLISYEWFKAVFQILTLIFALLVLLTGMLNRTRIVLVGLFAVLGMLWCESCQTFYYFRRQVDAAEAVTGSYIARAVRAYFAGCIISAIFDLALIILLGLTLEPVAAAETYPATTNPAAKGDFAATNENVAAGNGHGAAHV